MRRTVKNLLWGFGAIVVFALQQGLVAQFAWLHTSIQLVVLMVLGLTIFYSPLSGLVAALVGGSWLDLHSTLPFGVFVIALSLMMFTCLFLRDRVLKQDLVYAVALPAVLGTLMFWGTFLLLAWFQLKVSRADIAPGWYSAQLTSAIIQSLVHGSLVALFFLVRRWVTSRFLGLHLFQR